MFGLQGFGFGKRKGTIKSYDGLLGTTDYWLNHAVNNVFNDFGDVISVEQKAKDLLKFGHNSAVGTTNTDIAHMPGTELHETYVTTNAINYISSDNGADTEVVNIEGHTVDGSGNFTFVFQTATLNGTTDVLLTTPLARVTRVYNNGSVPLVGTVSVHEGTTPTDPQIHIIIEAGKQQSEKCSTTISDVDYWIITSVYADVLEKTSAFADITFEVRQKGKIFRPVVTFSASNSGQGLHDFKPYVVIPKNADVRLTAEAGGAGTDVSGGIQGVLASIITS